MTLQLPHGRSWLYYKDLQILAVDQGLDPAGREAAVDDYLADARRILVTQLDRPAV